MADEEDAPPGTHERRVQDYNHMKMEVEKLCQTFDESLFMFSSEDKRKVRKMGEDNMRQLDVCETMIEYAKTDGMSELAFEDQMLLLQKDVDTCREKFTAIIEKTCEEKVAYILKMASDKSRLQDAKRIFSIQTEEEREREKKKEEERKARDLEERRRHAMDTFLTHPVWLEHKERQEKRRERRRAYAEFKEKQALEEAERLKELEEAGPSIVVEQLEDIPGPSKVVEQSKDVAGPSEVVKQSKNAKKSEKKEMVQPVSESAEKPLEGYQKRAAEMMAKYDMLHVDEKDLVLNLC